MKTPKRLIKYASENFTEVLHTTLDPEGPGVIRIHLIPPVVKMGEEDVAPGIVILNGQDILPVGFSWTILLSELIKEINKYDGKPITEADTGKIINNTAKNVSKLFPFVFKRVFKRDIERIMKTFVQVAMGKEPDEAIGAMTMSDYAPYMRAPHRMDLMVSSMVKDGKWHCNQKCVHCYAAGQEKAEETELSTLQWKEIIDKCRNACIPQLTFTGGEPTMRDDLCELIDYAKWFVTRLNTNGIVLTEGLCSELKKVSLDSIQITFYSSDENIHNKLVGAPQYDNTVKGIRNALAAGISTSINTPLCTLNKDYVRTLEFLHEIGVQYVTCSGLITTGNALTEESENLQLSKDEIKSVLKDAVDYCYAHDMEISFTSPGWVEEEFCRELGITVPSCGACLSNMAISPSGDVVPCQSWLSGDSFGNMLADKWEDIWNNPECVKRRDFSAEQLGICPLRRSHEE